MLYKFENNLENFVYWSNSTGDLPYNLEYDIEDLPKELQRAFTELWSDSYWANQYIAEFNGKYGIILEAEYDKYFAEDLNISYDELVKAAENKAIEVSEMYPEYDILFGKDAIEWSDGSISTSVNVFMPWDIDENKFVEVVNYFDSMCYKMD